MPSHSLTMLQAEGPEQTTACLIAYIFPSTSRDGDSFNGEDHLNF